MEHDKLIGDHPALTGPQPRMGINPFTKQPMEFRANPDTAFVIRDRLQLGVTSWAQTGDAEIDVMGSREHAEPLAAVARDVAEKLGAELRPVAEEE